MKRGYTIVELSITIIMIFIVACMVNAIMNAKREHDAKANVEAVEKQEKPRFVSEDVTTIKNKYALLVRDTKTGREWLMINEAGVIEVTPETKNPEKEKQ